MMSDDGSSPEPPALPALPLEPSSIFNWDCVEPPELPALPAEPSSIFNWDCVEPPELPALSREPSLICKKRRTDDNPLLGVVTTVETGSNPLPAAFVLSNPVLLPPIPFVLITSDVRFRTFFTKS